MFRVCARQYTRCCFVLGHIAGAKENKILFSGWCMYMYICSVPRSLLVWLVCLCVFMRLVWLQMDMNIKQMWRISACMIFLLGLHIKKDVGGFIWRSAEGNTHSLPCLQENGGVKKCCELFRLFFFTSERVRESLSLCSDCEYVDCLKNYCTVMVFKF
jgi:hypothetical protein